MWKYALRHVEMRWWCFSARPGFCLIQQVDQLVNKVDSMLLPLTW